MQQVPALGGHQVEPALVEAALVDLAPDAPHLPWQRAAQLLARGLLVAHPHLVVELQLPSPPTYIRRRTLAPVLAVLLLEDAARAKGQHVLLANLELQLLGQPLVHHAPGVDLHAARPTRMPDAEG